jgi:hypothetical protein
MANWPTVIEKDGLCDLTDPSHKPSVIKILQCIYASFYGPQSLFFRDDQVVNYKSIVAECRASCSAKPRFEADVIRA